MSTYTSNGRDVYPAGRVPLTDDIMAALRERGLSPYIADMAGGCFGIALDVPGGQIIASNGDGWLPSDSRGGNVYGLTVAYCPGDGGDADVWLDEMAPHDKFAGWAAFAVTQAMIDAHLAAGVNA